MASSLAAQIHELYNGRNLEYVASMLGLTPAAVQARLLDPTLPDPPDRDQARSVQVGDETFGVPLGKTGQPLAALAPGEYWRDSEQIAYAPRTLPAPIPLADWWTQEPCGYGWVDLDCPVKLDSLDFDPSGSGNGDDGGTVKVDIGFDFIFGPGGIQREWVIGMDFSIFTWADWLYGSRFNPSDQAYGPYDSTIEDAASYNAPYAQFGVIAGQDAALPRYVVDPPPFEWTGVRYQTVGEAPNRVFVVEHVLPFYSQEGSPGPGDPGQYGAVQIHLREDGAIEVHVKHFSPTESQNPPTMGMWWMTELDYFNGPEYGTLLGTVGGRTYNNQLTDPMDGPITEQAFRCTPTDETATIVADPSNDYSSNHTEALLLPCAFPFGPSGRTAEWWIGDDGVLLGKPSNMGPEDVDIYTGPNAGALADLSTVGSFARHAKWAISLMDFNSFSLSDPGHVRYAVLGDVGSRVLVVELQSANDPAFFGQIHLHESGVVELHYGAIGADGDVLNNQAAVGLIWDEVDGPAVESATEDEPVLHKLAVYDRGGEAEAVLDADVTLAEWMTEVGYRFTPIDVFTSRGEYPLPEGAIALQDLRAGLPAPHAGSILAVRDGALIIVGEDGVEGPVAPPPSVGVNVTDVGDSAFQPNWENFHPDSGQGTQMTWIGDGTEAAPLHGTIRVAAASTAEPPVVNGYRHVIYALGFPRFANMVYQLYKCPAIGFITTYQFAAVVDRIPVEVVGRDRGDGPAVAFKAIAGFPLPAPYALQWIFTFTHTV